MTWSDEELREICRRTIETIVGRYGWHGVWNEAEFVEEILAEIESRLAKVRGKDFEKIVENAATFCYCRRWHQVCCVEGTIEQHEAFDALWKYVYRSTFYSVNGNEELAKEVAQDVLLSIWQSLEKVREPGAFLGYVKTAVLRQIPKTLSREPDVEEIMEDISDSQTDEEREEGIEKQIGIEELIRLCLRSENRQRVLIDLFLNGKSIGEIAQALGKSAGAVTVLKHRAIDQLRQCEELHAWRDARGGSRTGESEAIKSVGYLFAVLDAAGSRMDCDECRSWLPAYVEAEVSGFDVAERYPEVRRHLDFCVQCEREYVELLDATLNEAAEGLPDIDVPPADLSFLPSISFQVYIQALLRDLIERRLPARLSDLDAQIGPFLRQMAAFGDRPVPVAVGAMSPDRTFERLNLATYDVARAIVQMLQSQKNGQPIPLAELSRIVQAEAQRASRRQNLETEEAAAFVTTVTELLCRNPSLLQRLEQ